MTLEEYYEFVKVSDVSKGQSVGKRRRIGVLGLVSEIGSVLAALKKSSLLGDNGLNAKIVRGALKEEIGDAIWYAIMLSQILEDEDYLDKKYSKDIFRADIKMLHSELSGSSENQAKVQKTLGDVNVKKFLKEADSFLKKSKPRMNEYQNTAFITARTEGAELRDICAALLLQLSAQCIREFLPASELKINDELRVRPVAETIGKIVWHLSALAKLHKLSLHEIIERNVEKAEFRNQAGSISKRYDVNYDLDQQFPKKFEIRFTDTGEQKAIMTWEQDNGISKKLGSELTDNNYDGDGYRFHDVMHISFAVHLGWSPNLRSFMERKRKDRNSEKNDSVDMVEDGGRAKILEEMVILQVHTHAQKLEDHLGKDNVISPFENEGALGFEFLQKLHELTRGHEVEANPVQDWREAIKQGYDCFYKLKQNDGGTILADMHSRKISFRPLEN